MRCDGETDRWIQMHFACVSFVRVKKKTEPYPGRWTTHIVIGSADEVDEELLGWVAEAYTFASTK